MLLGSGSVGGGPGRPLKCMACDLWSSSYDYWLTHLTSESHQDKVGGNLSDNPFGHEAWTEDADCCLKVTEVNGIDDHAFVTYLGKFGTLLDFIKQQDERKTEYYFVKYETPEPANKILSQQKRAVHQVQGRSIYFRRKYEQSISQPGGGSDSQKTGIGLLATEYWDANDEGSALGSLQATYDDDEHNESGMGANAGQGQEELGNITSENGALEDNQQNNEDEPQHDLFSMNMIQHLANSLSDMSIEDQLDAFCKNILLSEPFLDGRFKLVEELLTLIKARYPKCTVYPCGMDFVGIGDSDDPVNVYVDLFDNVFSTQKQPWETNSTQHWTQVFQVLKSEADNLRFCCKVSKTAERISFEHVESGVKVCIRLSGYAIVQEAVLIKFLCTLDPRVRPLLALARYWSSVNKIFDSVPENKDNRGRLSVLLMIFHLTNRNIIPTLTKLQTEPHEKTAIHEGIDLSFCTDKSKLPQPSTMLMEDKSIMTLSALSLLQDFLQRFGIASLKDNLVSLWYGKFIKKEHLVPQNTHLLPDDFATKLLFGHNGEVLKQKLNTGDENHQLCVQDLFDPTLNLGINIDCEELKKFQTTAWKTGEKLERVLNSGTPVLMNIFLTSAEDEKIEKEQELERQKEFQEMHKQVQQEQQRLIQMKQTKDAEERVRQAKAEAEALHLQQLRDEEEQKRIKNREEEQQRQRAREDEQNERQRAQENERQRAREDEQNERQRQKNREQEQRQRRLQVEEDDRRRRTHAQRQRDEERQRLIQSEEEEQRRFVQKQQVEQRQQKERDTLERQRREALDQIQQNQKRRLEEEQDRLERSRSKQFEQDHWKLSQQARQAKNPVPSVPPPSFSYNKLVSGDNGHALANTSSQHSFPMGSYTGDPRRRNVAPNPPPSRTGYQPYEGRPPGSGSGNYPLLTNPKDQLSRDPERSVGGITAKANNKMEEDDWLNTEWEEFSKSLEAAPSSFLNMHQKRPVAPVAPSQKPILRSSQYFHDAPPPPPPRGLANYGRPEPLMPSSVVAAKGPMRYDGGKVNVDYEDTHKHPAPPKKRRSTEFLESESSEDSSSSSGSDEEDEADEEDEKEDDAALPTQNSRIRNPYPLPKIKLCPFVKNMFLEACESKDFAYGIRGKLQTLFLQFMKEFNNRFWKNCFGFEIELDPTYQDTTPLDYAKFGDRKSIQMTNLLTTVPCFEENFSTTFFCQSTGKLSTLLTHARPNDLRNGKFIRKQASPMLKVLMDEVPPHLVPTNQNLRFKVEVNFVLDYQNLNKDCHPYVKMVFDKGLSTQNEMLALFQFFGKLYGRMSARFLSYCFKRWLASCTDFDIKATERKCILLKHQDIASGKMMSRKDRRKLRRLKRSEKKKQNKMKEFQATSWAASTPLPRAYGIAPSNTQMNYPDNGLAGTTSYGRVAGVTNYDNVAPQAHSHQFLQNRNPIPQIRPLMADQHVPRTGRFVPGRGKTFQVPSSWNRTIEGDVGAGAGNNPTANPPPFPPYSNNTTNNNMMYRRHF